MNTVNEEPNTTLTINDLQTVKEIIDLACSRGAFRAAEFKIVGELYEKLDGFLSVIVAKAQAETQTSTPQGETE